MTRARQPVVSGLGLVLERMVVEAGFRAALTADVDSALRGYVLDEVDRELIIEQIGTGVSAVPDGLDPGVARLMTRTNLLRVLDAFVAGGETSELDLSTRHIRNRSRAS